MNFGSPNAGASPNSNSILAQPPLQEEMPGQDAIGNKYIMLPCSLSIYPLY